MTFFVKSAYIIFCILHIHLWELSDNRRQIGLVITDLPGCAVYLVGQGIDFDGKPCQLKLKPDYLENKTGSSSGIQPIHLWKLLMQDRGSLTHDDPTPLPQMIV